ncbi:photosystem II assembly protein Psb35 [Microcoleus sp. D3_18_C2]|uniref:photosystem II assembly protein Psb35 n=1 Tax=Microcoleus sp. D3_18_C2 TaxID=3055334 RepID=UPI002FD5188E
MQQPAPELSISLATPIGVLIVGFLAAVTIGSIAWYNSKRPPGWESKERPDFVPKVDKDDLIADVSDSKGK